MFPLFIITPIVCVVLIIIMAVAHKPAKIESRTGALVIQYGLLVKAIGYLTGVVMPVGLLVAIVVGGFKDSNDLFIFLGLEAGFLALGGFLLLEALKSKVLLYSDGLTVYSPWRQPRSMRWCDVVEVSYSASMMTFGIKDRAGQKVGVHAMMTGVPSLAVAIRSQLPPDRYRKAAAGFATLRNFAR